MASRTPRTCQEERPLYSIYRDNPPGVRYDLQAPILFSPPEGSDALFDGLRQAFPHIPAHGERFQEATLRFIIEERDAGLGVEAEDEDFAWTSAALQDWFLAPVDTELTIFSEPDLAADRRPQDSSRSTTHSRSSSATYSQTSGTPSQAELSSVFSLTSSAPPRQYTRRKMTEEEKQAYRQRRRVKACEKCARDKRKVSEDPVTPGRS